MMDRVVVCTDDGRERVPGGESRLVELLGDEEKKRNDVPERGCGEFELRFEGTGEGDGEGSGGRGRRGGSNAKEPLYLKIE